LEERGKIMQKNDLDKSISQKKQQAILTKGKIYATAMDLIRSKGYTNVTIKEICEKSGVTKGAFYHHFDSKSSILESNYLDTDSFALKKLPYIMEHKNSLEQTRRMMASYAEMVELKGVEIIKQSIRNNLDSLPSYDGINNFYNNFYGPQKRPLIEIQLAILKTGQEKGEIRNDMSPESILRNIISVFNGFILDWCYHNGNYDFKQMIQDVLSPLMAYYERKS
jgi:TetR/AcrR family transcriptional regulator, fatty acid metabolism regulator protein